MDAVRWPLGMDSGQFRGSRTAGLCAGAGGVSGNRRRGRHGRGNCRGVGWLGSAGTPRAVPPVVSRLRPVCAQDKHPTRHQHQQQRNDQQLRQSWRRDCHTGACDGGVASGSGSGPADLAAAICPGTPNHGSAADAARSRDDGSRAGGSTASAWSDGSGVRSWWRVHPAGIAAGQRTEGDQPDSATRTWRPHKKRAGSSSRGDGLSSQSTLSGWSRWPWDIAAEPSARDNRDRQFACDGSGTGGWHSSWRGIFGSTRYCNTESSRTTRPPPYNGR
jgi:hypothetical protein